MKKKIAIISLNLPFPLSHGGAIAQYFFLENISENHEITFITIITTDSQKRGIEVLRKKLPLVKFIFLETIASDTTKKNYWIELKVLAHKILSRIGFISKKIYEENFLSAINEKFVSFLHNYLESNHFDFFQIEFFEGLVYLDYLPKNKEVIFVHHEVKYKTILKQSRFSSNFIKSVKEYEIENLKKADKVIVFNKEDKSELETNGVKDVFISKFGLPKPMDVNREASTTFQRFIFLGSEFHFPNMEGLVWFLDTIFIPNYNEMIPIHITGNWGDKVKKKYSKYKKIIFTGFVENLSELYDHSVLVCPLLSGSGIRTKILEAFLNRVPVFSTAIGAEGLYNDRTDNHIVIFDQSDFLEKYRKLFQDQFLVEISSTAYNYYHNNFLPNNLTRERLNIYELDD